MIERDPAAERLLGHARAGHEPSAADVDRVRALLHARILATPQLLSPAEVPGTGVGGAARLVLGKAAGVFGLCAIGAVAVGLVHQEPSTAPPVRLGVNAPMAVVHGPDMQLPLSPPASPDGQGAAIAEPSKADQGTLLRARAPSSAERSARAGAGAPSASVGADNLQVELSGLRNAQRQLHAGNAAQAVVTLDNLSREVPSGVLTEDRAATRVIALCILGRTSSDGAAAFLARFPGSVHATRVQSACGGSATTH